MKWFKHMSNMRNDARLKKVINRYGLEGYGLYNIIIESITESLENESPLPVLQEDAADIADFYNADTTKVLEMIHFMVNIGLFDFTKNNDIVCIKIYKHLQSSQTRSKHIRKLIENYSNQTIMLEKPLSQTVLDNCEEQNRTEQNRIEQNRIEYMETKTVSDKYPELLKTLIKKSNEFKSLTSYRGLIENMPRITEVLDIMRLYTEDEIKSAFNNYNRMYNDQETYQYWSYKNLSNFIIEGVPIFIDGNEPLKKYLKPKTFQQIDQEREKELYSKVQEEYSEPLEEEKPKDTRTLQERQADQIRILNEIEEEQNAKC